ncbi:MAG: 2-phospho-L-lactate transferase CofD family protein, partial [Chloroflexota bacterium]|nr:2-phospho-L-lactate transferase CofD family protein [Chloroflexota bacterium]
LKVYVCNVATQAGETENFSCGDHAQVIDDHVGSDLFDLVLANNATPATSRKNIRWVRAGLEPFAQHPFHLADLVDAEYPWRHNSQKLAQTLIALLQERTGPLTL